MAIAILAGRSGRAPNRIVNHGRRRGHGDGCRDDVFGFLRRSFVFAAYHSYNEPAPALRLAEVAVSFRKRYDKPVMIGEFGLDWRGWSREQDPYFRGLRQAIWGGALGGSVGSGMSWWWQDLHRNEAYPQFHVARTLLSATRWGRGQWEAIAFQTSGPPPTALGEPTPNGTPFDVQLALGGQWGDKPAGELAIANPGSANFASTAFNSYFHGTSHSDLRVPFVVNTWLADASRLVMHLNSVSSGAVLTVRVDGTEQFRTNLVNRDGGWQVNGEYDTDIAVELEAGLHRIEIVNRGADWFFLDWVWESFLPVTNHTGQDAFSLSVDRSILRQFLRARRTN